MQQQTNHKIDVGVVYLVWLPYGIRLFADFIESYKLNPAGFDHDFIIALNGTMLVPSSDIDEYISLARQHDITIASHFYFESGQDILIYSKVADATSYEYLIFLNSFTQILAPNWLLFYIRQYQDHVGIIGSTGSYASYLIMQQHKFKRLKGNLKEQWQLAKYIVKLRLLFSGKFPGIPNPHIRTTGFFIRRTLFCSLKGRFPKNKLEAYFFENGRKSMTRQILDKGLECLVIDKLGNVHKPGDWKNAHIFWNGKQEQLLLSDNQTRKYDIADDKGKVQMQLDAWGRV